MPGLTPFWKTPFLCNGWGIKLDSALALRVLVMARLLIPMSAPTIVTTTMKLDFWN